ncbi:MAG: aminotransferase class V-fold PLP-dependent enzyme [Chloroflexi bacterium]|nr:aminotransferase class V-fold PLP-dependent enzyme [Chloroflexota bacterium]MCL5273739.1 aminotransferase class V-fold PLP-dependent enzyme [Chloroflexota bacterium]
MPINPSLNTDAIEPLAPAHPGSVTDAEAVFLRAYPEYASTGLLDELRTSEYARLDRQGHTYLDYTGGGLYAASQISAHLNLLLENVYGNPHSSNPTSLAMTHLVEQTRASILEYFNASPDEYLVIFTLNASGALKLVGESYPFGPGDRYLLTFDNHNSVNGIREFARARGASVTYAPVLPPDLYIDADKLSACLNQAQVHHNNLFAYPAQSNFSGVQHSLEWIERAQSKGWDVLLDAAAFVPTNQLDLSRWHPDFVCMSFYKLFGYPTGVGCLLARKQALAKLRRPWFAGGTITVASVQGDRFYFQEGSEAFEDGTINYLALPAVDIGLRFIQNVGIERIHTRVKCLTGWLLDELTSLRHGTGAPVVHIYGPIQAVARGGTVTLNFYDPQGRFIDHRLVEQFANQRKISLRTGCFCNPGGGELALGISAEELTSCFIHKNRLTLDEFRRCIDDKSTGAVRVSLGIVSTFADVYRFIEFARTFQDRQFE